MKDAILSVAREGEITHEFTVKGLKFVLKSLSTEEQILADGMIDTTRLKEKYGAKQLATLNDTVYKYRTIAMIALGTKTINGQSPVTKEADLAEQFKQRSELRDELMELQSSVVDQLIKEYNVLIKKENEFGSDLENNMEK